MKLRQPKPIILTKGTARVTINTVQGYVVFVDGEHISMRMFDQLKRCTAGHYAAFYKQLGYVREVATAKPVARKRGRAA
jgi:hypothetical protein